MKRNEKDTSLPAEGHKSKRSKKQKLIFILCVVVIIGAVLFTSIKNTVNGFYGGFVLHDSNTASALAVMDGLQHDDSEQKLLSPLQTKWDLYRGARLDERVGTTASDGVNLSGLLYDEGSDITVIALHDFDGSAEGDFLYGSFYSQSLGANLLLPDSRDHGKSGGSVVSYGYLESDDLLKWVDWVLEHYGSSQKIIIQGDTMGAAAALMASSSLPDQVKLIVAESPYDSLKNLGQYELKTWYKLPSPFLTLMEWRNGKSYSLDNVVVTDAVRNAKIPAVFLAGTNDTIIPESMTQAVYNVYGGEKNLILVDAKHGMLYATDQTKIEQAILDAWNQYK
jgi:fermentation-respiration switch protein FrsA (DUF1100 family)